MVLIGCFFGGGVEIIEISLIQFSAKLRLLGIGVALSDKISGGILETGLEISRPVSLFTQSLILLSFSLSITQNLCSSSITINPRFLKFISGDKSL
ncbi:TPA: hypothetical protein DCZ31_00910 [Patescibacteria group bacterium]|nr:hypothetical protein [Candidatus Gracilibacteria bacterium]